MVPSVVRFSGIKGFDMFTTLRVQQRIAQELNSSRVPSSGPNERLLITDKVTRRLWDAIFAL